MIFGKNLLAAEAGMPQLDPKYWASQAFWLILIFTLLYLSISKFFVPKIRNSIDVRNSKIKDDLDEAKHLKDMSEKKLKEYESLIVNAKREVQKIYTDSKKKLNNDIQNKKKLVEKEIDDAVEKAQSEINNLKKNSIDDILKISEKMTATVIEEISGDKLNESSIKATISEVSKKKISNYL
tara:strand:- start:216 stop:758 length:543 start_codon:yes stop_codon:yes gene_type:complete